MNDKLRRTIKFENRKKKEKEKRLAKEKGYERKKKNKLRDQIYTTR